MPSRRSVLQFLGVAPFVKPDIADALPTIAEQAMAAGAGKKIVPPGELTAEMLQYWKTSNWEIVALSVYNDDGESDDA